MVWLYRYHLTTPWHCCFYLLSFPSLPSLFNTFTVLHPHNTGGVSEKGAKGRESLSHGVITTPNWGLANSENQIRWPKSLLFLSTSSNMSLSNWELNIIQTPPLAYNHLPPTPKHHQHHQPTRAVFCFVLFFISTHWGDSGSAGRTVTVIMWLTLDMKKKTSVHTLTLPDSPLLQLWPYPLHQASY